MRNVFGLSRRIARRKDATNFNAEPKRPTDRMRGWIVAAAAAWIGILPLLAQPANPPQDAQRQKQTKWVPPANPDRGQEVFQQNCSRCHNAPEGFSSRVSGSVALHMRVRANLSAEDYKALLHFLNP
jgi:mono/diheme cytochrome c family protein